MVWPAVIGGLVSGLASGAASSFGSKSGFGDVQDELFRQWNRILTQQNLAFGQSQDAYRALAELYDTGYTKARAEAERVGESARQGVLDRGDQKLGTAQQGLVQSGLFNTSTAQQLKTGVQGQTSRELLDIDSSLAQLFSNLEVGRTAGKAQAQAGIAGLGPNLAQQQSTLGNNILSLMYGSGQQGSYAPYQSLGQGLGGIAALIAGGFGGGGGLGGAMQNSPYTIPGAGGF